MAEVRPDSRLSGKPLAEALAGLVSSKLASDIVILDMRDLVSYTDFLVVCSARNERQAQAITDEVRRVMKDEHGMLPVNPAPAGEFGWTVLDYMDAVLHVFSGEARDLYDLEELWFEAPRIRIEADANEGDESGGGAGDPGTGRQPDSR